MADHGELHKLRAAYREAADRVLALWPEDTDPDDLPDELRTQIEQAMANVGAIGNRYQAATRK